MAQAEGLREQQRESKIIRAIISVQTTFRRRRQVRERRSRTELIEKKKQTGRRDAAASRIQRAWRRHRAPKIDQQRRKTKETPPALPPLSSVIPGRSGTQTLSVPATKGSVTPENTPNPSRGHPKPLGAWSEEQQPDKGSPRREDWSVPNPPHAANRLWKGLVATTAAITDSDGCSDTSDKAAGEPAPSQLNAAGPSPPSGMMTVRVRRGSEETSLETPIVLTESGVATSEAATDGEVSPPGLDNEQKKGAHQPWVVYTGSSNDAITSASSDSSKYSTKRFCAGGDGEAVDARSPSSRLTKGAHGRNDAAELVSPASSTAGAAVRCAGKHQAGDARSKALVPTAAAARKGKDNTARPWSALEATTRTTLTTWGEDDTVAAATSGTALDETLPTAEQFFMEDSQVYLGCATCGVKYLVEAVDSRLPESAQGIS